LKTGRFSAGASEEKKKKEAEEKTRAEKAAEAARAKAKEEEEKKELRSNYKHQHKRSVLECSLVCSQEEEQQRYNELPAGVRLLLSNMQKVDKNVCLEPVEEGDAPGLWEKNDVPYDHTELGSYIRHRGVECKPLVRRNKRSGRKIKDWRTRTLYSCWRCTLLFAFQVTKSRRRL
jgi:hypothetical protein